MDDFEKAFAFTLAQEGGYINDLADSGGETKFGISKKTFPHLNIANLTESEAKKIYRDVYWGPAGCEMLAAPLNILVFDTAVNLGTPKAGGLLQKILNDRFGQALEVDGIVGKATADTANTVMCSDRQRLCLEYLIERISYYVAINQPKFLRGWIKRVLNLRRLV